MPSPNNTPLEATTLPGAKQQPNNNSIYYNREDSFVKPRRIDSVMRSYGIKNLEVGERREIIIQKIDDDLYSLGKKPFYIDFDGRGSIKNKEILEGLDKNKIYKLTIVCLKSSLSKRGKHYFIEQTQPIGETTTMSSFKTISRDEYFNIMKNRSRPAIPGNTRKNILETIDYVNQKTFILAMFSDSIENLHYNIRIDEQTIAGAYLIPVYILDSKEVSVLRVWEKLANRILSHQYKACESGEIYTYTITKNPSDGKSSISYELCEGEVDIHMTDNPSQFYYDMVKRLSKDKFVE